MNIYPVFYGSLLELVLLDVPRVLRTEIKLVNLEQEYIVEGILDYKYVKRKIKYLIK